MVMYACRNTGFQRMVDFWKRQPNDENWKEIFKDVFEFSVEQFYVADSFRRGDHGRNPCVPENCNLLFRRAAVEEDQFQIFLLREYAGETFHFDRETRTVTLR